MVSATHARVERSTSNHVNPPESLGPNSASAQDCSLDPGNTGDVSQPAGHLVTDETMEPPNHVQPSVATVLVVDRHHVLLLRKTLHNGGSTLMLPSSRVAPLNSAPSDPLCDARTAFNTYVGHLPATMNAEAPYSLRRTVCVGPYTHYVFKSPVRLHKLRQLFHTMMSARSADVCREWPEAVLMPWASIYHHKEHIDTPSFMALADNAAYFNELRPSAYAPLPICPVSPSRSTVPSSQPTEHTPEPCLVPEAPAPPPSIGRPFCSLDPSPCWIGAAPVATEGSQLLLLHRKAHGGFHEVLLRSQDGIARVPSVEPSQNEPPSSSMRRLLGQYFSRYDSLLRCTTESTAHGATALGRDATCIPVDVSSISVRVLYSDHWVWAPLPALDAVKLHPADRRAVNSALKPYRTRVQTPHSPLHVLTMPPSVADNVGLSLRRPLARSADRPVASVEINDTARDRLTDAFLDLQAQPDGKVNFDSALLERLIACSRDRARSRGAAQVQPRDIAAAAQTLVESKRSPSGTSPADTLPLHYDSMMAQLQNAREAAAQSKLGRESRAPRVLVAGETSGVVASMFAAAGADVATCDLDSREKSSEMQGIPHFKGNASYIVNLGWDLVIAHPPCTYLANVGVQYLHTEEGRMDRMREAAAVFEMLRNSNAPYVCLEQPKMHKYARRELGDIRASQYTHPWEHGTGHTKPTGLYLKGLPSLEPTCVVPGRLHAVASLPPGANRGSLRSRTYLGIAGAMALQWMPILQEYADSDAKSKAIAAADLVHQARSIRRDWMVSAKPPSPPSLPHSDTVPEEDTDTAEPSEHRTRTVGVVCEVAPEDIKPWLRERLPPSPHALPVTQLRCRAGRWKALVPSGGNPPKSYLWHSLSTEDNESVSAIASKLAQKWKSEDDTGNSDHASDVLSKWESLPGVEVSTSPTSEFHEPVAYKPLAAVEHRCRQVAAEQATWRSSQRQLQLILEAQTKQVLRTKDRETQHPRKKYDPNRVSSGVGLRAEEESLPAPTPHATSLDQIRRQFERFVRATPVGAAACVDWESSGTPIASVASAPESTFTENDIAEIPPPLAFDAQCAYIKDFAVARKGQTRRQGMSTVYSVGSASCIIKMALGDSGAGPSCIGSALLSQLPKDACVSRTPERAYVKDDLVGPNGQPLISRGSVTIVFTMDGHPFRHDFMVIEGGDLLLLGNDFLGRYRATVTPVGDDNQGHLRLRVKRSGVERSVSIGLSCERKQVRKVGAVGKVPNQGEQDRPLDPPDLDSTAPTEEVEEIQSSHPALVPIDGVTTPSDDSDETASAVTANELVHTQMTTSDYLLYNDKPLTIPARTETTTWIRAPHVHHHIGTPVFIDRLPERLGIDIPVPVACGLAIPDEDGFVPVRVINTEHKAVTIPASSPLAHLTVEFEVKVQGALDVSSGDPYKRLSSEHRKLIDSIVIDPESRLTKDQLYRVRALLAMNIEAFAINPKDPTHTHVMDVRLPLKEGAVPHRHAASRLGPEGQAIVDAQVAEMEAHGIIRKSNSAWGSRVVLVKKKTGEIRFCIDFRDTNRKLQTLDTPIPRCDEAIDRLASGAGPQDSLFLCTLDLAAGFWTLPIKESDKGVTAFVTHRGKYEWNYLPFGVQSGPSWMCSLMDAALQGLAWECCMPYLDDVAVWSTGVGNTVADRENSSFEQMLTRLGLVLERLRWAGLSAKASKCTLFATSADYLGHVVSRRGLEMDPKKLNKIKDMDPKSINTLERVRSFLGLCSYYRRFVKGFATITAPLSDLTKDGVDVANESQRPEAQQAIVRLIEALTTEPVILKMPRFDRPFVVKTDGAQTEGIGGCLVQHDDEGRERVVAYYGRRLTSAERNYTVTEIELLAALECIRTWRPYLWGRRFKLVIDHAALKWLHTMKDTVEGGPASRLMRWILKLQEYDFEVEHKPGKNHADADAVSRLVAAIYQLADEAPSFLSDSEKVTLILDGTSSAFKDWAADPSVTLDDVERVRKQVVATIWPNDGSPTFNHTSPIAASTARSLWKEMRREQLENTSKQSITEQYVSVGTPTASALRAAQAEDPECQVVHSYLATGSIGPLFDRESVSRARWAKQHVRHLRVNDDGLLVRVDPVSPPSDPSRRPAPTEPVQRLFIPKTLRDTYLHAFHDHFGHPGEKAMSNLMRSRVYWPSMSEDIRNHVSTCHECTFTTQRRSKASLAPTRPTVGSYPFDSVVCDIVKMKLTADGFDQMIVFADSLSRWVEAVPCRGDPDAAAVLDAYTTHVACRYGWPREIRADGGSNIIANQLAEEIHRLSGVDLRKGAAYHPQSQGVAERVQKTLAKMCATANEGGEHWVEHLPYLLFSYHATPHRSTGLSPAMIMYGRELRLPAQLGQAGQSDEIPDVPDAVADYAHRQHQYLLSAWHAAREAGSDVQEIAFAEACAKHNVNTTFEVNQQVCYRLFYKHNKLTTPWFGPCRVDKVLPNGNYLLRDLPNNAVTSLFHVSQLRAYNAYVDAAALQEDEFLVDRLLARRGQPNRRQYLVKWRGYPRTQATWEPRSELLRRCRKDVEEYDKANYPPPRVLSPKTPANAQPRSPAKSKGPVLAPPLLVGPQPRSAAKSKASVLTPPLLVGPNDLYAGPGKHGNEKQPPHRAIFDRGRWRYARNVITNRGTRERLYDQNTFMPTELESAHFAQLRVEASKVHAHPPDVVAALSIHPIRQHESARPVAAIAAGPTQASSPAVFPLSSPWPLVHPRLQRWRQDSPEGGLVAHGYSPLSPNGPLSRAIPTRTRRVLILFSGPKRRPDGIAGFLAAHNYHCEQYDTSSKNGGSKWDDLTDNRVYEPLLRRVRGGYYAAVVAAPPCSTFSVCRLFPSGPGDPPVVRDRDHPMGRTTLGNHTNEVRVSNILVERTCELLQTAYFAGTEFFLENPADRGSTDPQDKHLFIDSRHAPMWLMPGVRRLQEVTDAELITFSQCLLGSIYQKYTSVLCSPEMAYQLRHWNALRCPHARHPRQAGGERGPDGKYLSHTSAAYPTEMNRQIAKAIVDVLELKRKRRASCFCYFRHVETIYTGVWTEHMCRLALASDITFPEICRTQLRFNEPAARYGIDPVALQNGALEFQNANARARHLRHLFASV